MKPFSVPVTMEHRNLRIPIAMVVDDGTPCINPLFEQRVQVDGWTNVKHKRRIPVRFMREFSRWVRRSGVRGCFSVLPNPAGLGEITESLRGFSKKELDDWLKYAREYLVPQLDIHCELLTHTRALDLKTMQPLAANEQNWAETQTAESLGRYMAHALQILKDAGLQPYGVTQPWAYRGDERVYASAVLSAEKAVNQRKVSHYFIHMDETAPTVPPRVTHLDLDAGEAVVSYWASTNDYIWGTQEAGWHELCMEPEALAERYVTADGAGGRLAQLIRNGSHATVLTHWQSLFSNGTWLGFRTFQCVAERINRLYRDVVEWRKVSEIAEYHVARETCTVKADADLEEVIIELTSKFESDALTFTVPLPWTAQQVSVTQDGEALPAVNDAAALRASSWLKRGSTVSISVPVTAGKRSLVKIKRWAA